ncbi:MAG: DUF1836 domain-containing protein [Ruthenibacterium sp.]
MNQNIAIWKKELAEYHLPRWNELPDMELYMDQVIGQLDKYLALLLTPDAEHFITASMINNYVKLRLLPPPVKKRYSRTHLAYLVVICLLKQVLSIPEIKQLLELQMQNGCVQDAYDSFCGAQESAFINVCTQAEPADESSTALAVQLAVQAGACKSLTQKIFCVGDEV